jgi:hypothetical protein
MDEVSVMQMTNHSWSAFDGSWESHPFSCMIEWDYGPVMAEKQLQIDDSKRNYVDAALTQKRPGVLAYRIEAWFHRQLSLLGFRRNGIAETEL